MEAELDTCRARLCAVEAQLLEVLEEKLRLKQEVEAWEVGWSAGWTGRGGDVTGLALTLLSPTGGHAAVSGEAGAESAAE